jgi:hypothetical protein
LKNFIQTIHNFVHRHPGSLHVLVAITYLLFTFYYMTPQVVHCTSTVYGFGDNTAGPIWRHSVSPQNPLGGYERVTNYPFGDNLYSPVGYSAVLQSTAYWGLAKVAGPICGYNIINFAGFVLSALVMYGFIYAITKKRSIAWLAGYAASFTPYFQVKVGGHPGYGYQALLIGIAWLFFNLLKHRRKKYAVALGVLLASCFYFDPYFSLLGSIVVVSLGLTWLALYAVKLLRHKVLAEDRRTFRQQLKLLVVAALTATLLLVPLAYIKIKNTNIINSTVSSARGNVLAEARACSILPHEYASPFVLHPVFTRLFGGNYYKTTVDNFNNHFTCGIGEASVGISITVITLATTVLIIFAWDKLNKRRLRLTSLLGFEPKVLIFGVMAIGLVGVLLGLPPTKIGFIPTPSELLLSITTTWRTLARVYVLVNMSLVILFAIALAYFANNFKQHKRLLKIVFIVLFFLIFIEYQAFRPLADNTLNNFDYSKDVPKAYVWLRGQSDIQTIAEYPLERGGGESDAVSYYLSMQRAHQKALFNSALPNSPQESIRSSLKDLSDPQTIPTLEALGIDTVVVHGLPASEVAKIPYLKVVYSSPQSRFNLQSHTPTVKNDIIVIARLIKMNAPGIMMQLRKDEFPRNTNIIFSAIDWQYEALQDSHIDIKPVISQSTTEVANTPTPVCFEVRMSVPTDSDELTLIVDGKSGPKLMINGNYQTVRTSAVSAVQLHNKSGHNMQIENLGCPSE